MVVWEGGEVGGEEFCYFEGGVDGEAVLEGLWMVWCQSFG